MTVWSAWSRGKRNVIATEYGIVIAKERHGANAGRCPSRDGRSTGWPEMASRSPGSCRLSSPNLVRQKLAPAGGDPVANFSWPRGLRGRAPGSRGRHRSEGTGQYYHTAKRQRRGRTATTPSSGSRLSRGRNGGSDGRSSHGAIVRRSPPCTGRTHLTAIWPDVGRPTPTPTMRARAARCPCTCLARSFLHARRPGDSGRQGRPETIATR